MKKLIAVLVVAFVAMSATFAIDMSAGGGLVFGSSTTKTEYDLGYGLSVDDSESNSLYGAFGFFDATYVQVSIGYVKVNSDNETGSVVFDVLGKYPFDIGTKFKLFPLAGIGYQKCISIDTGDEADASHFVLKGGVGGDFAFTEKLYARATGLFGYFLDNKTERDYQDDFDGKISTYDFEISAAVGYKF